MESNNLGEIRVIYSVSKHPIYGNVFYRKVYYNDELVFKDVKKSKGFWNTKDDLHQFWMTYDLEAPSLSTKPQCCCTGNCRNDSSNSIHFFRKCRLKLLKFKLQFMKVFFQQKLNSSKSSVVK